MNSSYVCVCVCACMHVGWRRDTHRYAHTNKTKRYQKGKRQRVEQFKLMEGLGEDAIQKGIAIVKAGGDEGVDATWTWQRERSGLLT